MGTIHDNMSREELIFHLDLCARFGGTITKHFKDNENLDRKTFQKMLAESGLLNGLMMLTLRKMTDGLE